MVECVCVCVCVCVVACSVLICTIFHYLAYHKNCVLFRWFKFTLKPSYSMTNYNWPFGTVSFGLFGSNLDTKDLEAYPRTYSGHF